MAYKVEFTSFNLSSYKVIIGDEGGTLTPLIGGPEPFVTHEDSDGDLFTPVRLHNGVIQVVDDGTLMASIIPSNNISTKVRLKSSTNTTYWEGFLCAAGYTQPWDGNLNLIELPVQSVLSSLYDTIIDTQYAGQLMSFSDIINAGLDSIGYSYRTVTSVDDNSGAWMKAKVNASVFFRRDEISNQGDRQTALFGRSYGEIIEDICRLFGLMCRDTGTGILFATYDRVGGFGLYNITSDLTFKGIDNSQGFLQGRKNVAARLSFKAINDELIALPFTTEDSSTVYTIDKVANGVAKVQPHNRSNSGTESFYYYDYSSRSGSSAPTSSSYSTCKTKSVIGTPIMPAPTDDPTLNTGAFAVRYSYNPTDSGVKLLANGLMVNMGAEMSNYNFSLPSGAKACYSLTTEQPVSFTGGYLNIEMLISCFMETNAGQDRKKLQYGIQNYYYQRNYRMFLKLQWGDRYWSGTGWSYSATSFDVVTDGSTLLTNIGEDTMSTKNDGLFIPVVGTMTGYITLSIMNFGSFKITYPDETTEIFRVHSSIISKLRLLYVSVVNETASERTENVYRQDILNSGFSQDEEVSLNIGTMNNNIPSNEFIKSSVSTYIETMSYYDGTTQRPEMHLITRMASYYGQVRQTLRATVGTGINLFSNLFRINGNRRFVGIDAQHNWRDDTQEVEFIEVKQI